MPHISYIIKQTKKAGLFVKISFPLSYMCNVCFSKSTKMGFFLLFIYRKAISIWIAFSTQNAEISNVEAGIFT